MVLGRSKKCVSKCFVSTTSGLSKKKSGGGEDEQASCAHVWADLSQLCLLSTISHNKTIKSHICVIYADTVGIDQHVCLRSLIFFSYYIHSTVSNDSVCGQ